MRAFGASAETLAQARRELVAWFKHQTLDVMPENWFAVRLFDAMGTQWRVLAVGGRMVFIGLDYAVLPMVLRSLRGHVPHARPLAQVLPQIQVMEAAAIAVLNKA